MSQQGTPFGAITPLNQARMSAGTFSYCPLSKAKAAPASMGRHASSAICANLRMRSSTALHRHHGGPLLRATNLLSNRMRLSLSQAADACSKNMLTSRACEIDAVRNQLVTSFAAARSPAIPAMLLVEPGVAGGEMTAGLGRSRDQIECCI